MARSELEALLRERVEPIYLELTDDLRLGLRAAELVYAAAARFPALVPSRAAIDAERALLQKDKQGLEIDQGIFVAHVLADPRLGRHLLHAMSQRGRRRSPRSTPSGATGASGSGRCASTATGTSATSPSKTTPS